MTRVKICGITNYGDARHAVECGTDSIGFNFYEKSPRYVEPAIAKEIIDRLPDSSWKVGVFVNELADRILEIADTAGLNAIQLHGDETHSYVTSLHRKTSLEIIKAVRTASELEISYLLDFDAHSILIDGHSVETYGGSGIRADWLMAKEICGFLPYVYLAGGLSPETVRHAINSVTPYGVDVASGVESSPGKKDPKKVEAFIRNAKSAL